MKDIVKKSLLLGLGAASMTKAQAEKVVKELVKRNAVTIKEGKDILRRVKKHAANESKRVKMFAEQELKRAAKDLGFISKTQVARVKKSLKSIDKELSARGKRTLSKIIKDLSK